MVRSKLISKNDAKKILSSKSLKKDDEEKLTQYILDKLDISSSDYKKILDQKNKNFRDFKTYYNTYKYFKYPIKILASWNLIPKLLYLRYFG